MIKNIQTVKKQATGAEPQSEVFRIDNKVAAKHIWSRVKKELETKDFDQKMKMDLGIDWLQDQLNAFEASLLEENKVASSLCNRLIVIFIRSL